MLIRECFESIGKTRATLNAFGTEAYRALRNDVYSHRKLQEVLPASEPPADDED